MKALRLEGLIYEAEYGDELVYILNEPGLISPIEYKIMEGLDDDIFVKMIRLLINGKPALYYLTDEYRPVLSIVQGLGYNGLISVIGSIIENAFKLMSNGFLTCKNADASIEHIYVMKNTYKTAFLYLPIRSTIYDDEAEFERKLRGALVEIAKGIDEKDTDRITELINELENINIPLIEILNRQKKTRNNTKTIKMLCLDDKCKADIEITKDEFIIGKWADQVDGVISFNRMISRIHCKISIRDSKYYITDLKSANGTFVNGIRLTANKPFPIKNGDTIRLADSRFRFAAE